MTAPRSVITIGTFDGVHLGHRAILRRARAVADRADAQVLALMFDPSPLHTLRPDEAPPRILGRRDKARRLRDAGADDVVHLDPTPDLLGRTAEEFVASIVERYRPVAIVEGPDFRFGRERRGDAELLARLGERFGFTAHIEPGVEVALTDQWLAPVSSSLVRWLVGRGRVLDAARCLDRPFALEATVVHGEQKGRLLGTPTANLDMAALAEFILPADGVYAGTATIVPPDTDLASPDAQLKTQDSRLEAPNAELETTFAAAISVGTKPTLPDRPLTVEAYLLEFSGDLYGRRVRIGFDRWIRDQLVYPDLDTLRRQIDRDAAEVDRLWREGWLSVAPPVSAAMR